MRTALIIFTALFMTGYVFTSANAKQSPTIDEIDALLSKVSKNVESAGEVTKMAQTMNAKMVESKVAEKEALKEAVVVAEQKVDVMTKKVEVYAVKMIGAGLDTSEVPLQLSGKAYDAWLNYVEEGGKEDFEYFRLYIFN
jgi:Na+/phosphate symporter